MRHSEDSTLPLELVINPLNTHSLVYAQVLFLTAD